MRRVRAVVGLCLSLVGLAVVPSPALAAPAPIESAAPPPPRIAVLTNRGGLAPGYTFVGPKGYRDPTARPSGLEIIDGQSRPVWWHQAAAGAVASDFRVQSYHGQPVLTWSEGVGTGSGHSNSTDYIADSHYQVIARVNGGDGLTADNHEFQLTSRGTALITAYRARTVDLSSVGGPTNGQLMDSYVQEIDIATGNVVLTWDAYDHVPITDSHQPLPSDPTRMPWDFFHVNSAQVDTDGNLLISGRHTWAGYQIDRATGAIRWQLGGKHSSFRFGPQAAFAWQHDLEPVSDGVVRVFDNGASHFDIQRPQSRVITLSLDTTRHTATLVNSINHPDHLSAESQGNAQLLPDGHLMVGWGQTGRVSEFDADGRLIFDARIPASGDTYRAYRCPWVGRPADRPTAAVRKGTDSSVVRATWNGATQVASWKVYSGPDADHLRPIATAAWNGLSTTITVPGTPAVVQVFALNSSGAVLARSEPTSSL